MFKDSTIFIKFLSKNPSNVHESVAILKRKMDDFLIKFEVRAVEKYVHLVDLVKRFPTSICLQKSVSIQPITSLSKFEENE